MSKQPPSATTKIAIVCKDESDLPLIDFFLNSEFCYRNIDLIGLASTKPGDTVCSYAREKGLYTTKNYLGLLKLKDLKTIINLVNDPIVTDRIKRSKPPYLHLMDDPSAGFLLQLLPAGKERITKRMPDFDFQTPTPGYHWDLFNHALAGLLRVKLDGSILMCNQSFANMVGCETREEVISTFNIANHYDDPERRKRLLKKLRECGNCDNFEFKMKRKDGSLFWALNSIKMPPGKGYLEGMVIDVTKRKMAEEEIRYLTQRLLSAQEEEKKRIAQDLHDELGQALSTLQFGMNALMDSIPVTLERQRSNCERIVSGIERMGDMIRHISAELRPVILDQLGLIPALKSLVESFRQNNVGIRIDFEAVGLKKRLNSEIEIALYRIVQEALTNVAKHGRASRASIFLTLSYPNIIVTVRDNGIGFDKKKFFSSDKKVSGGIGLLGMRERIDALGGEIEIRTAPGKGTIIRAKTSIIM